MIAQGRLFLESSPKLKVVGGNQFACVSVADVCIVSQQCVCVYPYIYTHACMAVYIHVYTYSDTHENKPGMT